MSQTRPYEGIRVRPGEIRPVNDELVVEAPLTIAINGEPLTVTMQTPGYERELTRGLLFTEGIFKGRESDPDMVAGHSTEPGYIDRIDVTLGQEEYAVLNKRSLLSVSACGICGKTGIDFPIGKVDPTVQNINVSIPQLMEAMASQQTSFMVSGGCHAAAIFDAQGEMLSLMEDVGRHNAVDKVIGDLLYRRMLSSACYLTVSGRVSYEIVTKCFMAGIPVLAAVSSPSSLAIDYAKELGISLLGFCRDDRYTIYAHPERLFSAGTK